MKKNINDAIFSRMAPLKKVELINKMTPMELDGVSFDTVLRCVKEVGERRYSFKNDSKGKLEKKFTRDKDMRLSAGRRVNNGWNSTITGISYVSGKLYVSIYVQMNSTDRSTCAEFKEFFSRAEYTGKCYETNRYGDEVPHYFKYDKEDKQKFIKNVLLEYIHTKYAEKLAKTA